jgi:hypothetical protein
MARDGSHPRDVAGAEDPRPPRPAPAPRERGWLRNTEAQRRTLLLAATPRCGAQVESSSASEGKQTHGWRGCRRGGNAAPTLRTRQRINALESTTCARSRAPGATAGGQRAAVTRHRLLAGGLLRRESARREMPSAASPHLGGGGSRDAGNGANPMTGSGLQHARDPREEKAVEGVRNPEDGTCGPRGKGRPMRRELARGAGVDSRGGRRPRPTATCVGASPGDGGGEIRGSSAGNRDDRSLLSREREGGCAPGGRISGRWSGPRSPEEATESVCSGVPGRSGTSERGARAARATRRERSAKKVMERVHVVPSGARRREPRGRPRGSAWQQVKIEEESEKANDPIPGGSWENRTSRALGGPSPSAGGHSGVRHRRTARPRRPSGRRRTELDSPTPSPLHRV